MKERTLALRNEFLSRTGFDDSINQCIDNAVEIIIESYKNGGKLLICGNGGSCSDSDHIVGELMKGFLLKRPLSDEYKADFKRLYGDKGTALADSLQGTLPAINLTAQDALLTAFANDVDPAASFAQQVWGYAQKNDVLIGISTSGNSDNIIKAVMASKVKVIKSIALTGKTGGKLKDMCDCCIAVPETETFKIQELHIKVYHYICAAVESEFFDE